MDQKYAPLFTPWKIGNVTIKNRIVMTSMGGTSLFGWMEPLHFDKESAHFILERAQNNVGLLLPGIAPLKNPIGGRWLYQNKHMFKQLKVFMNELHKTGAKLFVQLTAGFGRSFAVTKAMEDIENNAFLRVLAKPILDIDYLCASASANPNRWSDKIPSKALTIKQIHKMIEAFAKTAKLCQEAGVDGVEIHAVHEGYLLDQFTMKYTNQRTDEYGGSFENRYRFPVEIVKAIKATCGKDFPVSLRYSIVSKTKGFRQGAVPGEDYVEAGRDMAESEKAARLLQDAGYDMLNCDNGTYDAWYWAHPPLYMPLDCNLAYAEHIKQFVDIPVTCAGRMEPDVAAQAIKEGKLDAMGVARQFLADPAWVSKLMADKVEEIKPCICCHNGCFTMAHYAGVPNDQTLTDAVHMARCAINAETMQTKKHYLKPTKKAKNVVIIGGGIGGMEAAIDLTKRGHHATIYEKAGALGGVFVAASTASFKEKDRELLEWYRRKIASLPIDVKLNHEVKTLSDIPADAYVIATGSAPHHFSLKGGERAIEAIDYFKGEKAIGENVTIIGGGLTGCEIAYDLVLKGKKPTIIEMKNDLIAVPGVCMANSTYLRDYLAYKKVPVYLETKVTGITDTAVTAQRKDGTSLVIPSDSVVVSIGYRPMPLVKKGKNVYLVGDCGGIGNLRTVIWRAYEVAMAI